MKYLCFVVATVLAISWNCYSQITAFSYQGRLNDGANPANGEYEFRFQIWDSEVGGSEMSPQASFFTGPVSNGLFTAILDFGGRFDGLRWLEIEVRTNGGGAFTTLSPRHLILATPYSIKSEFANTVFGSNIVGTILPEHLPPGVVTNGGSISGIFTGDGTGLTLSSNVALRTGGNSFSGTQFIDAGALNVNSPGFNTATAIIRARQTDKYPFAVQDFSGNNLLLITNSGQVDVSGTINAPAFAGNGASLTTLNAANITSGALSDARLSANVALRSSPNTFTGNQTFRNSVTVSNEYSGRGDLRLWAFQNNGSSGTAFVQARDNSGTSSINLMLRTQLGGQPIDVLSVRSNGNVGIGVISPNFPLSFDSIVGDKISLYGDSFYHFGFGIQPGVLQIHTDIPDNDITFGHGSGADMIETVRFKGNGLVGIGTGSTTPSAMLHVRNKAANTPLRIELSSGAPAVVVASNGFATFSAEITTTAINLTSDRNAKEAFRPVNPREVLEKVTRLPVTEWQYKANGDARHIGPMAQDFHQAFGLGRDDKHITSVDADGVALAAIQGLHDKLEEKTREVEALKQSVAELRELVTRLAPAANR